MAWFDEGKQRFEFGFDVGNSQDSETCVMVELSAGKVDIIWTRESLEKFIADATATLASIPPHLAGQALDE